MTLPIAPLMTPPARPTVGQLLGPSLRSPGVDVALDSRTQGVPQLARLSSIGRRLLAGQIADRLDELLAMDVATLAEKAWLTYDRLIAAGYRTAARRDSEVVEIGRHTITSTHHPEVDVIVDERLVTTVHFVVTVGMDVEALVAAVQQGFLVALHPGPCVLTAALACEDVPLPSATVSCTLPGRVDLRPGLRLVPDLS